MIASPLLIDRWRKLAASIVVLASLAIVARQLAGAGPLEAQDARTGERPAER